MRKHTIGSVYRSAFFAAWTSQRRDKSPYSMFRHPLLWAAWFDGQEAGIAARKGFAEKPVAAQIREGLMVLACCWVIFGLALWGSLSLLLKLLGV